MIKLHAHGQAGALIARAHPGAPQPLRLAALSPAEAVAAAAAQTPGLERLLRGGAWRMTVDGAPVTAAAPQALAAPADEVHLHPAAAGAGFDPVTLAVVAAVVAVGVAAYALSFSPAVPNYAERDAPENQASYLFDGPVNTQAQGGAVPLVVGGPMRVGSVTVSGGIQSVRI
ncbi:MAG: hypothetical protein OXU98_05470 [Gammaproteobacteria bacterium]|nr:hypothetical protein [Gammaproteobacteria bacterium]